MGLVRNFNQLSKDNVMLAGGKGASLGEMTQAGIPVPPGFVVLSDSFERFLEETNLKADIDAILHKVNHQEIHTVEHASAEIQGLILGAEMPRDIADEIMLHFKELDTKYVAVRSSATSEDSADAAWAGQLDSFLNTTEDQVLEKVKQCWASLFTPRAIFYRFEKGLHGHFISVAVVVQKMVVSEVSGIAFSVHPVTEDPNQLIIEAGYGLGEAIVSGSITPDSYVIEKDKLEIIDTFISEQERGLFRVDEGGNEWRDITKEEGAKQKLTNEEVKELAKLIMHIEDHYSFPCDIEWAQEDKKFYIVQSRPITTLSPRADQESKAPKNILEEEWTKVWTTEYALLSIWSFGREYIESCDKAFGVHFNKIVFLIEGDLATIYRVDQEQKDFAYKLAERSLNEEGFAQKVVDQLFAYQKELEANFELSDEEVLKPETFHKFFDVHFKILPFFLLPLWSPNAFDKLTDDQEVKDKLFKLYEHARKETEHMYPHVEKFLQRVFKLIADKEGANEKYLRAILPDELLTYLEEGTLPDEQTLKERYDYSVVISTPEKNQLIHGEDARNIITKISHIDTEGIEIIKGVTANGGKVTGKAKLIFMEKDSDKVEEGDILVTTMTRPEWLPIMQKAAAFVTDAGGVLCHAAIVSRELNKPCVISTKIATQVLKDGDLIEVDATNGEVRILESEQEEDYIFMWATSPGTIVYWASPTAISNRRDMIPDELSFLAYYDGEICTSYIPEQDLENVRQKVSPRFLDPKHFQDYREGYLKEKTKWWEWVREIEKQDFTTADKKSLLPVYKQLTLNFYDAIAHFWTSRPEWTFAVEQRLTEILKSHFGEQWPDIFGELVASTELDDIQKQLLGLTRLVEGEVSDEALLRHASEYPWLIFGQFDKEGALKFLHERAQEAKAKSYEELKEELDAAKVKIAQDQQAILAKLSPEEQKEAEYLAGFLKIQANERMEVKAYWAGCFWLCRDALKRIAELAQMPLNDLLSYISPDEVLEFLSDTLPSEELKAKVENRRNAYAIVRGKGEQTRMVDGEEATKLFKEKVKPIAEGIVEIKGQTASRGTYTGKIRKVIAGDLEDLQASISDFQQGEILVTSMTQPNMMVLANRAGAIITDEGGITSHAAIISRELRIPCIVGCLHAMQTLNDGDTVEVNANEGIVRKIKDA